MIGLLLYRWVLLPLWSIFMLLGLLLRGPSRGRALRERLGSSPPMSGPVIWLHGASLGEIGPARRLAEAVLDRLPGHSLLITCNSTSGRDLVSGWGLPRTRVQLAPLDLGWVLRRFLSGLTVTHYISVENELWPNRLFLLHHRQIPVGLISARLSDRALRRWQGFGQLGPRLMQTVHLVAPQSPESRANLLSLGLPPDRLAADINLKALVRPAQPDPQELARLKPHFPRESTILAASTHEGEDDIICHAFGALLAAGHPELRLILAPRKPARAEVIAANVLAMGLSVARRSRGEAPVAQVYLADTLHEMPLWYSLASVTFVGGSLRDYGGHTPFEPLSFDSAVLHGPFVHNFSDVYQALDSAGGAIQVTSDNLQETLGRLIFAPDERDRMVAQGLLTLESKKDVLSPFLDTFVPSKTRTL